MHAAVAQSSKAAPLVSSTFNGGNLRFEGAWTAYPGRTQRAAEMSAHSVAVDLEERGAILRRNVTGLVTGGCPMLGTSLLVEIGNIVQNLSRRRSQAVDLKA